MYIKKKKFLYTSPYVFLSCVCLLTSPSGTCNIWEGRLCVEQAEREAFSSAGDAQRFDAAEVDRRLVNYNRDTEPPWTAGCSRLPRLAARFIKRIAFLGGGSPQAASRQTWTFLARNRHTGPRRPPQASVMLSGKRDSCSQDVLLSVNGRINEQQPIYSLLNILAHAWLCRVFYYSIAMFYLHIRLSSFRAGAKSKNRDFTRVIQ